MDGGHLPDTGIAPVLSFLLGQALDEFVSMACIGGKPDVFLIVVLHIAVLAESGDVLVLLDRLVADEVVRVDAKVRRLLLPYSDPDGPEAAFTEKLGGIEIGGLNELRPGGVHVSEVPAHDPGVAGQVLDDGAHGFKPRVDTLAFVVLANTIGRRGHGHLCSVAVHELGEVCRVGAVAAHEPVDTQLPNVAGFCDRAFGRDRLMGFVHIEIILHGFGRIEGIQKLVHFGGVEAGHGDVKLAAVEICQQGRQLVLVPFTLNFVEGEVQRLFAHIVQIDDDAIDLGIAKVLHDRQALVAADHVAAPFVPDHGLDIAELGNAALQLFVLRVSGEQFFSWVVGCGPQLFHRYFLNLHEVPPMPCILQMSGTCRRRICCLPSAGAA